MWLFCPRTHVSVSHRRAFCWVVVYGTTEFMSMGLMISYTFFLHIFSVSEQIYNKWNSCSSYIFKFKDCECFAKIPTTAFHYILGLIDFSLSICCHAIVGKTQVWITKGIVADSNVSASLPGLCCACGVMTYRGWRVTKIKLKQSYLQKRVDWKTNRSLFLIKYYEVGYSGRSGHNVTPPGPQQLLYKLTWGA